MSKKLSYNTIFTKTFISILILFIKSNSMTPSRNYDSTKYGYLEMSLVNRLDETFTFHSFDITHGSITITGKKPIYTLNFCWAITGGDFAKDDLKIDIPIGLSIEYFPLRYRTNLYLEYMLALRTLLLSEYAHYASIGVDFNFKTGVFIRPALFNRYTHKILGYMNSEFPNIYGTSLTLGVKLFRNR